MNQISLKYVLTILLMQLSGITIPYIQSIPQSGGAAAMGSLIGNSIGEIGSSFVAGHTQKIKMKSSPDRTIVPVKNSDQDQELQAYITLLSHAHTPHQLEVAKEAYRAKKASLELAHKRKLESYLMIMLVAIVCAAISIGTFAFIRYRKK